MTNIIKQKSYSLPTYGLIHLLDVFVSQYLLHIISLRSKGTRFTQILHVNLFRGTI